MTGAARQQCPEGPATQSRPGSASAGGSAFRCCRTTGAGLRHFVSPGLSLSRASAATEGTGPSRRIQKGVYRQTSAQPDSAGPGVRGNQTIVHQRGGQPGAARAAAARARAWVSRNQIGHAHVVWNIDLIACCQTSWRRCTSCWCRRNGRQWAEVGKEFPNRRTPIRR